MTIEPNTHYDFERDQGGVLLVACGALAREIIALIEANRWAHFDVACLPAKLHNRPERIPEAVRGKIRDARGKYRKIFVLYGDCGTGGALDRVLQQEGVERIDGPHCYSFFTGNALFAAQADDDVTSFYLTDYLARHFDTLVWEGLAIDRHPELLPLYFGHYERLVYLAQTHDADLARRAEGAAARLGLTYEHRFTGYGDLAPFLAERATV